MQHVAPADRVGVALGTVPEDHDAPVQQPYGIRGRVGRDERRRNRFAPGDPAVAGERLVQPAALASNQHPHAVVPELEDGGLAPWNVVEGDVSGLGARDAVMIDKTYLAELGVKGVGDTAQVGTSRVRVAGLTEGIRSFTVTPFVFTTLNRARQLIDMPADNITYVLVKVRPGADAEKVRDEIRA